MNNIEITLNKDKSFTQSTKEIGRTFEDNSTKLIFTIEEELENNKFFLDIFKPDGKRYRTFEIPVEEDKAEFIVPNTLLDKAGNLEIDAIIHGENYSKKFKTITFNVSQAIDAIEEIPDEFPDLADKMFEILDLIETDGEGNEFLSNDGTYKEIEKYNDDEIKQEINNIDIEIDELIKNINLIANDIDYHTEKINNIEQEYNVFKEDIYTKEQVDELIGSIENVKINVVDDLPEIGETNVIYFVRKQQEEFDDVFYEYVWENNQYELIGNTQIDLSDYITTGRLIGYLNNFYNKNECDEKYQPKLNNTDDYCVQSMLYGGGESGYRKYKNGMLEQWGVATTQASETEFTMHQPHIDQKFSIFIEPREQGNFFHYAIPSANQKFKCRIQSRDSISMAVRFQWRSWGRWK